eukprot:gene2959-5810_t
MAYSSDPESDAFAITRVRASSLFSVVQQMEASRHHSLIKILISLLLVETWAPMGNRVIVMFQPLTTLDSAWMVALAELL